MHKFVYFRWRNIHVWHFNRMGNAHSENVAKKVSFLSQIKYSRVFSDEYFDKVSFLQYPGRYRWFVDYSLVISVMST